MGWKAYKKWRFQVLGNFNPSPGEPFFDHNLSDGTYVIARLIHKFEVPQDRDVVEGEIYPIFWYNSHDKADAPVPPFEAGDGVPVKIESDPNYKILSINYNKYPKKYFKIFGHISPFDQELFPWMGPEVSYKLAVCKNIDAKDINVKAEWFYVIRQTNKQKCVEAPNPPFTTGSDDCKD
jgi:hypothetical protein